MPRGLKPVRRRLADGSVRTYWYHRASGRRLTADPASAEGFAEVARLDAAARAAEAATAALAGSYAALWTLYRDSPAWRALKPRTRADYQAVRDWLGAAADTPVAAIRPQDLERLRDRAASAKGLAVWRMENASLKNNGFSAHWKTKCPLDTIHCWCIISLSTRWDRPAARGGDLKCQRL